MPSDHLAAVTKSDSQKGGNQKLCEPIEEIIDDEWEEVVPIPPDGGWGYIIVFASFMCFLIVDGIAYVFGVLLVELVEYFDDEGSSKIALIGSLLCGIYLCTGPFVGGLVNYFGCRVVTIAGSIVACMALLFSSMVRNANILIFLYGVVQGIGFGLIYLPSVIIVSYYFELKRSLAVGFAVCGSGVGAIVFAPIMDTLLRAYHWKSSLYILAGLVLNCAVFGSLYKPLLPTLRRKIVAAGDDNNHSIKAQVSCPTDDEIRRYIEKQVEGNEERKLNDNDDEADNGITCPNDVKMKLLENQSNAPAAIITRAIEPRHRGQSELKEGADAGSEIYRYIHSTPNLSKQLVGQTAVIAAAKPSPIKEYMKPLYRKDIFYSGSVFNIARFEPPAAMDMNTSNQLVGSWVMSMTRLPALDDKGQPEVVVKPSGICRFIPAGVRDIFSFMTDCTLMRNSAYALLWVANLLAMLGFYVPNFFLMDFAVSSVGIDKWQATILLSVMGVLNTLARVFFGWLGGLKQVSPLLVNNVTLLLSGVVTILLPFCHSYALLLTYSACYGFLVAPLISLTSEILCQQFGVEYITNAFGLLCFSRGFASSIGPPLAGLLRDYTDNFDLTFYIGGFVIILGSVLHFLLFLPRYKNASAALTKDEEDTAQKIIINSTLNLNANYTCSMPAIISTQRTDSTA